MNDRELIRFKHMRDAAKEALSFLKGRTREDLSRDRMLLLALIKDRDHRRGGDPDLGGIEEGRAADSLARIVAMRKRLIHAYADIDLSIFWDTLTGALPELVRELERALADTA